MTRQRKYWIATCVLGFAAFICGIQNEESNWWWLPTGVLGAAAVYCLTKVMNPGSTDKH